MPDAVTVIGLLTAGVLGGIGTWWSRRKLREAGVGQAAATVIGNLRDLADTWEEKYNLEHEALVSTQTALAGIKAEQVADGRAWAQCRSDLDDARSELRNLERRRRPRGPRVGEGT